MRDDLPRKLESFEESTKQKALVLLSTKKGLHNE